MCNSIPKSTSVDRSFDSNAEVDPYPQVIMQEIPDPIQPRRSKVLSERFNLEYDGNPRFVSTIASKRR